MHLNRNQPSLQSLAWASSQSSSGSYESASPSSFPSSSSSSTPPSRSSYLAIPSNPEAARIPDLFLSRQGAAAYAFSEPFSLPMDNKSWAQHSSVYTLGNYSVIVDYKNPLLPLPNCTFIPLDFNMIVNNGTFKESFIRNDLAERVRPEEEDNDLGEYRVGAGNVFYTKGVCSSICIVAKSYLAANPIPAKVALAHFQFDQDLDFSSLFNDLIEGGNITHIKIEILDATFGEGQDFIRETSLFRNIRDLAQIQFEILNVLNPWKIPQNRDDRFITEYNFGMSVGVDSNGSTLIRDETKNGSPRKFVNYSDAFKKYVSKERMIS